MPDPFGKGVYLLEESGPDEPILARRETVAAFVGPTPRGPVDTPVAVHNTHEFRRRFGTPATGSRMESLLEQFFDNGGVCAVVLRVGFPQPVCLLRLPAGDSELCLEALNPGPFEYLRAAVDYDGIDPANADRFNLVVHRIDSPRRRLVEEQEIYLNLSADPSSTDFVGQALTHSRLVRVRGDVPAHRPDITPQTGGTVGYVYGAVPRGPVAEPSDYDLIGSAAERSGLFALDQLPVVDLVVMLPGSPDRDLGPVALFAADRYCRARNALLLIDPPLHWTSVSAAVTSQRERGFASPNVATYFPRLLQRDGHGTASALSALGAMAGRIVAGDSKHGVAVSPGPEPVILRVRGCESARFTDVELGRLVRAGINPLQQTSSGRVQMHGLTTLGCARGDMAESAVLQNRRTTLFIVGAIARATRWAAFRTADTYTRAALGNQVRDFLCALQRDGSLAGESAADAFFVNCDTGPASPGQIDFVIGFALRRPGEFLTWHFSQRQSECRVRFLGRPPELALAS